MLSFNSCSLPTLFVHTRTVVNLFWHLYTWIVDVLTARRLVRTSLPTGKDCTRLH